MPLQLSDSGRSSALGLFRRSSSDAALPAMEAPAISGLTLERPGAPTPQRKLSPVRRAQQGFAGQGRAVQVC